MKNRLMQLAAGLALMAVLGKFYAVPLIAQVRAALVKNIDERGRAPYMVVALCDPQGLNSGCKAMFPAVPANRRLVVEYINGFVFTDRTQFHGAFLFPSALSPLVLSLPTHFESGDIGTRDQYSVSMPVVLYYEAGQIPSAEVFAGSGPVGGDFALSGYLVDLTL
jgi:hypothetical protein